MAKIGNLINLKSLEMFGALFRIEEGVFSVQ